MANIKKIHKGIKWSVQESRSQNATPCQLLLELVDINVDLKCLWQWYGELYWQQFILLGVGEIVLI